MTELRYESAFRAWTQRAGYGWETIRYPRAEASGETVAYRLTPRGGPRAVVLAVHGAGNDALFALVGLFKELLARGYEVFTFDMDGHGRASTTLLGDDACSAVREAVVQTRAAERRLPVHTVGISLGGAILLGSLPDLPSPPRSVSLLSAPLRIQLSWASIRRELGTPLLRTLWRERSHYGLTGLIPSFGPFKRGSYPLRLAQPPGPGPFGYVGVLNGMLERLSLEEVARGASIPVLLAYGRRDLLVPVEQAERLAQLLPRAELLVLDEETHLSAPMAPPALKRLLSWIEEH